MMQRARIGAAAAAWMAAPERGVAVPAAGCQRSLRTAAVLVAVCAACVVTLAGGTASAQEEELDAIERSISARGVTEFRDGVDAPSIQIAALDARWHILREAPEGSEQEARAFEALRSTALELGLTSLPAQSLVLLQQADAALTRGDADRAALLRTRAAFLSPDSAQPSFFDAREGWITEPWNAPRIVRALADAYGKMNRSIAGRHALASQWRQFAGLALTVLALLYCALLLLRHGGRLAYDLRLAMGRGPSLPQAQAFVMLVACAPALILWSPFVFIMTCAILTAVYLSVSERVLGVLMMAGICALPSLASQYATAIESADSDDVRALPAAGQPCDVRCERELRSIVSRSGSSVAALSLAWVEYRRGSSEGHERATELLADRAFEGALQSSAETLRGNLAFVAGDLDEAARRFQLAGTTATDGRQASAAWFNQFRVRTAQDNTAAATTAIGQAFDAGSEFIEPYIDYTGRSQNLVLMTSPIPSSVGLHVEPAPENRWLIDGAVQELLAPFLGAVPVASSLPVAGGVAAWMVIAWLIERSRVVARRCVRCATPTSRFVYAPAFEHQMCVLCYQSRTVASELTRDQLVAREQRVDDWRAVSRRASVIAAFVMPGAAQIVGGRAVLGALLLTLFAAGVGLAVVDPTPMAVPYSLGTDRLFDGRVQVAAFFIVASFVGSLALAAIDARRRR